MTAIEWINKLAAIQSARRESERRAAMECHPDNGKAGWWRVRAIGRVVLVRATAAPEAIAKAHAAGEVDESWQSPTAGFYAVELPDVISRVPPWMEPDCE